MIFKCIMAAILCAALIAGINATDTSYFSEHFIGNCFVTLVVYVLVFLPDPIITQWKKDFCS